MSLASDLLGQARHLARKEPRRPKQASLRRAVSTSYYALFHLLSDAAARKLVAGGGAGRQALRNVVRRAFVHGHMSAACRSFGGGNLPEAWQSALVDGHLPHDLRQVADAFIELQQARHEADYDLSKGYARGEALEYVDRCEEAFEAWARVRGSHAADTFLFALLLRTRGRP